MEVQDRQRLRQLVKVLGIALIVGGVLRRRYGAIVVGLILTALNSRQARSWHGV